MKQLPTRLHSLQMDVLLAQQCFWPIRKQIGLPFVRYNQHAMEIRRYRRFGYWHDCSHHQHVEILLRFDSVFLFIVLGAVWLGGQ